MKLAPEMVRNSHAAENFCSLERGKRLGSGNDMDQTQINVNPKLIGPS